jgi:hypothetical protein
VGKLMVVGHRSDKNQRNKVKAKGKILARRNKEL